MTLVGYLARNRKWVKPTIDRFNDRVKKTSGCWVWVGGKRGAGYGAFWDDGVNWLAHRWAYEHFVGAVPGGLTLDHLCRNTMCVNPEHLEPVTPRMNTLRGIGLAAVNAKKTHCKRGHEFTPGNTRSRVNGEGRPGRYCKECERQRDKRRRAMAAQFRKEQGGD